MDQHTQQTTSVEKTSLRKPYAKPAILETTPLEAVAYNCTIQPPTYGKQTVGEEGCTTALS
jgi:hypothetical protein